jgi:hypothetical protein
MLSAAPARDCGLLDSSAMEILTPKAVRRSTRVRVEIPVSVTSLDRTRPFADKCMVLVVSALGCGFRSTRALQIETPIMIGDLPAGGSVTARVANCLPLGNDGKYFLVGASLYTQGNVWQIANPPEDWNVAAESSPAPGAESGRVPSAANSQAEDAAKLTVNKKVWPYNVFSEGVEAHPRRR